MNDLAMTACPEGWTTAPTVDPSIALPADAGPMLLHVKAVGTQNYVCSGSDSDGGVAPTYAWTLVAPAADLDDCTGAVIGKHSAPTGAAAPQWTNNDGSAVVGQKVTSFTVDPNAIPWLLLAATSHPGSGVMSHVGYVQRLNTVGGKASGPCDVANVGATSDVPYTADYYFFAKTGL
ncbi:MAG: DUF3455 domain-containing protein [Actinomycetota bacterium]